MLPRSIWLAEQTGLILHGAPSGAGVSFEARADGTVFASKLKLQSAATGPSILLNTQGAASPGISPYQAISDGSVARVELGNLAANSVSPAQYGIRANDASGAPIFDSLGLIGVMKALGITDVGSNTFTSTTFAAISGSAISFTLSRQVNLLVVFLTTGYLTATGNIGYVRCNLLQSGVSQGVSGNLNFGPSNPVTLMGWRFYPSVAPAVYSLQLEGAVSATPCTLNTTESAIQVFQLGA